MFRRRYPRYRRTRSWSRRRNRRAWGRRRRGYNSYSLGRQLNIRKTGPEQFRKQLQKFKKVYNVTINLDANGQHMEDSPAPTGEFCYRSHAFDIFNIDNPLTYTGLYETARNYNLCRINYVKLKWRINIQVRADYSGPVTLFIVAYPTIHDPIPVTDPLYYRAVPVLSEVRGCKKWTLSGNAQESGKVRTVKYKMPRRNHLMPMFEKEQDKWMTITGQEAFEDFGIQPTPNYTRIWMNLWYIGNVTSTNAIKLSVEVTKKIYVEFKKPAQVNFRYMGDTTLPLSNISEEFEEMKLEPKAYSQ